MKLRFHGNTLRLRLSQSDVARLAETGRGETRDVPGGRTLDYVLETGETNDVRASFEDGKDSRDSGPCGGQAVDGRL